jgi:exopolyphosphatase/pppGpp-phosphohydrolase
MRGLVIHLGEGATHIIMASTRRSDLHSGPKARKPFDSAPSDEEEHHDKLFLMHDQVLRNGSDLSLRYTGSVRQDLQESMIRQAGEAMAHFAEIAEAVTIAISASLLDKPEEPDRDFMVMAFKKLFKLPVRVLHPDDEALWMLRGVRGEYPAGELACATAGYWHSQFAHEIPGKVPRFHVQQNGITREPVAEGSIPGFPAKDRLAKNPEIPFLLTGDAAWTAAACKIGLCFHDLDLLDGTWLTTADLLILHREYAALSVEQRNMIPMIQRSGDTILEALLLLRDLIQQTGRDRARICSRGVTHGLVSHLFYEGRRN